MSCGVTSAADPFSPGYCEAGPNPFQHIYKLISRRFWKPRQHHELFLKPFQENFWRAAGSIVLLNGYSESHCCNGGVYVVCNHVQRNSHIKARTQGFPEHHTAPAILPSSHNAICFPAKQYTCIQPSTWWKRKFFRPGHLLPFLHDIALRFLNNFCNSSPSVELDQFSFPIVSVTVARTAGTRINPRDLPFRRCAIPVV